MWERLGLLTAEATESAGLFFVSVTDAVIWMAYKLGGSLSPGCRLVYFGVVTAASGLKWQRGVNLLARSAHDILTCASPCSSVDRVLASGARDESSTLSGGTIGHHSKSPMRPYTQKARKAG